ncbi:MAG: hypothetical protein JW937_08235 [Candidatus Omnitrophica bacterium]|nr:hypothetical protein [Candidatus Omnitrophota bacterium]
MPNEDYEYRSCPLTDDEWAEQHMVAYIEGLLTADKLARFESVVSHSPAALTRMREYERILQAAAESSSEATKEYWKENVERVAAKIFHLENGQFPGPGQWKDPRKLRLRWAALSFVALGLLAVFLIL